MSSSDLQKEWDTLSDVENTARTVKNRLREAGLKLYFNNKKQRKARLEFAKDHLLDESNF